MTRRLIAAALGAAVLTAAGCGTTAVRSESETTASVPTTSTPTTASVPTTSTTVTSSTPTTFTTPTTPTTPTVATAPLPTVTATRPTPPPRPRHLRPGAHVVPVSTYSRDVLSSLGALRSFSSTLQGINSASQFRSRLTSLRGDLRTFDGMIRRLRSYQLASPTLDKQRARLAQQGPGLARVMSNFLDAVRDGNATRAKSLANEIQVRLDRFRKAA